MSRRNVMWFGAVLLLACGASGGARAGVLVTVDKTAQRMTVAVDGETRHVFAVSTGREGFGTPNGRFRPQRLERRWFSRKYYNSPMPHAIFFHGGFAIHGSGEISRLGGPASHGCVRLHPANAATLFALVSREGAANTRIVVTGDTSMIARRRLLERSPRLQANAAPPGWREPAVRARASVDSEPVRRYRPVYRAPAYADEGPVYGGPAHRPPGYLYAPY